MTVRTGLIFAVLLCGLAGCKAKSTVCAPGASVACTCTDGRAGAQICEPSGGGFAACVCAPGATAASASSTASGSSTGSTSATASTGTSTGSTGSSTGSTGATGSTTGSTSGGVPAVTTAHPRMILDAATLTTLRARAASNTSAWQALKAVCDSYIGGTVNDPTQEAYPDLPNAGAGYQGESYCPRCSARRCATKRSRPATPARPAGMAPRQSRS